MKKTRYGNCVPTMKVKQIMKEKVKKKLEEEDMLKFDILDVFEETEEKDS